MTHFHHLDSLYCLEEDHWEKQEEEEEVEEEEKSQHPFLEHDLFWDHHELPSLLSKQAPNQLFLCLQNDAVLASARREAVQWILGATTRLSFSPLTALLSVNYLDRFLFSFAFRRRQNPPWLPHLAAVASLSLAAKVQETNPPLSLHLQVGEHSSRYLFEARTVKRMEMLVLSTLEWRMNPVTPLSFIDYITRRLRFEPRLCFQFLKNSEALLLSVIPDSRFMSFLPSVLATATMMHVVNNVHSSLRIQYGDQLKAILGIHKEKVEECYNLMLESALSLKKRKIGCVPYSPNGVVDGSFSCDSCSNECWEEFSESIQSSPEPLSKKSRSSVEPFKLLPLS